MEKLIENAPLNMAGGEIVVIVNNERAGSTVELLIADLVESDFRTLVVRNKSNPAVNENLLKNDNIINIEYENSAADFYGSWEKAQWEAIRMRPNLIIMDDSKLVLNDPIMDPAYTGHSLGIVIEEADLQDTLTHISQIIKGINERGNYGSVNDMIVYANGAKKSYLVTQGHDYEH